MVSIYAHVLYLPDRVSVLASVSSAPEDWTGCLLSHVVDTHRAIIQTDCQEVGVGWVDVQTHHTTLSGVDEPG